MPVCSSSTLATATMSPGPADVDRLGLAALHFQELADLDVLAAAGDVHAVVFLERAVVDADEAQLLHERVDAGLEDLRDERAVGVCLELDFARRFRRGRRA